MAASKSGDSEEVESLLQTCLLALWPSHSQAEKMECSLKANRKPDNSNDITCIVIDDDDEKIGFGIQERDPVSCGASLEGAQARLDGVNAICDPLEADPDVIVVSGGDCNRITSVIDRYLMKDSLFDVTTIQGTPGGDPASDMNWLERFHHLNVYTRAVSLFVDALERQRRYHEACKFTSAKIRDLLSVFFKECL